MYISSIVPMPKIRISRPRGRPTEVKQSQNSDHVRSLSGVTDWNRWNAKKSVVSHYFKTREVCSVFICLIVGQTFEWVWYDPCNRVGRPFIQYATASDVKRQRLVITSSLRVLALSPEHLKVPPFPNSQRKTNFTYRVSLYVLWFLCCQVYQLK